MEESIFEQILSVDWSPSISFGGMFKLPLILVLIVCIFYAFMLSLRTKILVDTVESEGNTKIKVLVFINLLVSLIIGVVGTIIIVLA
ncbi:MAG TPA: hypothetical protein PKH06_00620 [Candidatus Dojkabacteria bacterium]|nr:hypothetical protein [Candidatus Dojkabacteria bacterium]